MQRPLPDNTKQSQQTNVHAPGWIRTHNLSRRAATDLTFLFVTVRIQDIKRDKAMFSSLTRLPKKTHIHTHTYMIYLLTAVGLPPGGSSTVHIYTHKQYREQHKLLIWKSADRAPSLRVVPWHLPYN